MKKLLMIIALMMLPVSGQAGYPVGEAWFCRVVGRMDQAHIMIVTPVWIDNQINNYDKREADFIKYVKKTTSNKFVADFKPKCRDYVSSKRAEKHRKREMETAKKHNFLIAETMWQWNPKETK